MNSIHEPTNSPPHRPSIRLAAAAAVLLPVVTSAVGPAQQPADMHRLRRVAVFTERGFPTVDAPPIAQFTLDQALDRMSVNSFSSARALADGLTRESADVLVLPHGSAFPLEAWTAIREFVRQGGGLVVLGGAPFEMPVRRDPREGLVMGPRQPTFAHELLVGPSDRVDTSDLAAPSRVVAAEGSGWSELTPLPTHTFALTVRLATIKDLPDEAGSDGQRDAILRPLVHVLDRDGLPRACPLLAIDRLRGDGAGGRWVFAPSDADLDASVIHAAVEYATEGAVEIDARPVAASVTLGETPRLRIVVNRPVLLDGEMPAPSAHVSVASDGGQKVWEGEVPLDGPAQLRSAVAPIAANVPLTPGLYHVDVSIPGAWYQPSHVVTGFWVRDAALLARGPRLSVSRDWIRADGRVFPIVGTTYMASDVDRNFLFEPNPHVWDADFAGMQKLGINFVRTGIWTGWSRAMLNPGAVDENVLRALEAYVQTAARHGIQVCFTFFAFQPPYFGGTNPFLDPRAIDGQRAFVSLIASRFKDVQWIHWDLINEPSYAPANALWTNQPVRDASEAQAWRAFVAARHGDDAAALQALWRASGDDMRAVPGPDDLSWSMIRDRRSPRKAYDFSLFSQDVVAKWAARLREVVKASSGDTLVTLGQDEGGTQLMPAQQLHAGSVDYTAVHTWWNNDDLLWDGVVTKVPEKPNLHQETGLMRLENVDGQPWRTPEDAARLLERKVAYAFASRGAGAVQWAWNINPYQPIDNESVIGIERPDGTFKPELRALTGAASFFATAAPWLDDFEPDPVVMVVPHARLFSGRQGGLSATKRVVHVLAERFGIVPTALSDQRLTRERLVGAKLIIVPDPEVLEDAAARALVEASSAGALVLVTGHLEGDPYGQITDALKTLGAGADGRAVVQHETTRWGGWATYDNGQGSWLMRGAFDETATSTGRIWREPLPLEFASESAPLAGLLKSALAAAKVEVNESDVPMAARVLRASRAALIVCVNETPADAARVVAVDGRRMTIPVKAGRARMVLVERATGKVLASTDGPLH